MTRDDFLDALRQAAFSDSDITLYKLTGPPEHWLTTYNTGFWGLNPAYAEKWRDLMPGDLFLFHSTGPMYIRSKARPGAIGLGVLGAKTDKSTLEWYNELETGKNGWPYLTHFSDIWWFGGGEGVIDEPFRDKMVRGDGYIAREAAALARGGLSFDDMTLPDGKSLISRQRSITRVKRPDALAGMLEGQGGTVRQYGHGTATVGKSGKAEDGKVQYPAGSTGGQSTSGQIRDGGTNGAGANERGLGVPYRRPDADVTVEQADPYAPDAAVVERGTRAHREVETSLADHLQKRGLEPRSPGPGEPNFDVAWEADGGVWVAEVKSLTDVNEEGKLRAGLGQVLRYQHLLSRGEDRPVRAVLFVERAPSDPAWVDLCESVGVTLAWPEAVGEIHS